MFGPFLKSLPGILLLLAAAGAQAQTMQSSSGAGDSVNMRLKRPVVKKPRPIRTELGIGARLNTNGWGIVADKGWVRSDEGRQSDMFYNMRFAEIEFSEVKHPKEVKHTNTTAGAFSDRPTPYIYGKINNFYSFKLGYGFRRMIAGKPEPGTVSIHWIYMGGISLGLAKPYYIDAYVPLDNGGYTRQTIKYDSENKDAFLNDQLGIGRAPFTKGLNEIKIIPGIHAKTGLHFDFAGQRKTVIAVDAGVSADYYTQKIELMANQDAYPYVFNIYAGIQFGKRW